MSNDPSASEAFNKAKEAAEDYAQSPTKLQKLIEEAWHKISTVPHEQFQEKWDFLKAMIRCIKAYATGQYKDIPWSSLVTIVAAVLYFVSPIDAIADFIPVVGYLDDAFVIGQALKMVRKDMEEFLKWEEVQNQTAKNS